MSEESLDGYIEWDGKWIPFHDFIDMIKPKDKFACTCNASKSAADWRDNGEAMYLTAMILEAESSMQWGLLSRPGASWKTMNTDNKHQIIFNYAEHCFGVKLDLEQIKAVRDFVDVGYCDHLRSGICAHDMPAVRHVWGDRHVRIQALLWFDQERASEEDNDRRDKGQ